MNAPWTAASAHEIGVPWLLDAIAPSGALGRRARARERTFGPGDEAAARSAIAHVREVADAYGSANLATLRATIEAVPDVMGIVERARSGGALGDVDFFELQRFLAALVEIAALVDPVIASRVALSTLADLHERLAPGRSRERSFYLDDAFDPTLATARAEAAAAQAAYDAARGRLTARIARYVGVEAVRDGEFVLMRDRERGPLPPEIRVVRETPAYFLCDLSLDVEALAALEARDARAVQVAEVEERVRARLTEFVAVRSDALTQRSDAIGELDALVARARFAQAHDCVVPEIAESGTIEFTDGRYLPLAVALERRGRRYAPISLELHAMAVVTGPNMGGKTAALRTLGFLEACVALGLPVPCAAARLPLFDEIAWLGIAATTKDDGLLSSFGAEVVALRVFLARAKRCSLVLIDEFARTTSPREGRALLVALLENLAARGAVGLAATHLSHVTPAGATQHFAIGGLGELPSRNGAPLELEAALQRIAQAMDYRLRTVAPDAEPPSDAIELADALGLDAELIARAKERL
jgi:DNA mismatch repair protein MutS2